MAVTINSGSTPTLAQLKADLLKLVEHLDRNGIAVQLITPGTRDHLYNIGKDAGATLTVS